MARTERNTWNETRSFEDVLACAKDGEGRAFEELYESMHRRVYAFSRTRGARDPEGLVNDVFVAVFGAIASFSGTEEQFKAWVFRITRNRIIDEVRRSARLPELVDVESLADGLAAKESVEVEALNQIGLERVLLELDVLTDDQREVLLLRTVGDLTLESVAAIMGKRIGAIKALQYRATKTLLRQMSDSGSVPSRSLHLVEW